MDKRTSKTSPHRGGEKLIEEIVLRHLDRVRAPGALAIRRARVARHSGAVDLMILPMGQRRKLILVEAKLPSSADAASKVVGQLLMYWSGALNLGTKGLECLHAFAADPANRPTGATVKSPNRLAGGDASAEDAWRRLEAGPKLQPDQIGLYIATRYPIHDGLLPIIRAARRHFGLRIRVLCVKGLHTVELFG